ncbi:MAG: sigma-70 family RNA polymerase sigma factor, partial [Planctomycetes bacterium]|nr:sigma-70 family RNA polymerase sigma factor [Planctomycetota bacterium]
ARDEARAAIRRKKHLALIGSVSADRTVDNPATDLERQERMEAVRTALARLSERDRDVLLLWDAGLNYAEIAAQAGLAKGAVGTTLARARQRLVDAHGAAEEKNAAH